MEGVSPKVILFPTTDLTVEGEIRNKDLELVFESLYFQTKIKIFEKIYGHVYCSKCGRELRSAAKFCPNCGTPLKASQSTQQAASQHNQETSGTLNVSSRSSIVANELPKQGSNGTQESVIADRKELTGRIARRIIAGIIILIAGIVVAVTGGNINYAGLHYDCFSYGSYLGSCTVNHFEADVGQAMIAVGVILIIIGLIVIMSFVAIHKK